MNEVAQVTVCVELTQDEAEWLAAASVRASQDTIVPGAAEQLAALAEKLRWPV